jgi:hypothetical protein
LAENITFASGDSWKYEVGSQSLRGYVVKPTTWDRRRFLIESFTVDLTNDKPLNRALPGETPVRDATATDALKTNLSEYQGQKEITDERF